MMDLKRLATLTALSSALLSGCATQIKVSYLTEPGGAVLFESGKPRGLTPMYLVYAADEAFSDGGCMRLKGIKLRWPSGAETIENALLVCASDGYRKTFAFERPRFPGLEIDEAYSINLKRSQYFKMKDDYKVRRGSIGVLPPKGPLVEGQSGQDCSRRSRLPPYYGKCMYPPDSPSLTSP